MLVYRLRYLTIKMSVIQTENTRLKREYMAEKKIHGWTDNAWLNRKYTAEKKYISEQKIHGWTKNTRLNRKYTAEKKYTAEQRIHRWTENTRLQLMILVLVKEIKPSRLNDDVQCAIIVSSFHLCLMTFDGCPTTWRLILSLTGAN